MRQDWLDYELRDTMRVAIRVSDKSGLADTCEVTVAVTDANDPPAFALSTDLRIDENPNDGAHIGLLQFALIEPGEHYSVTILNRNCPFAFDRVSSALVVRNATAFDFETAPFVRCTVLLADDSADRKTVYRTVTIAVVDVNEPPTMMPQQRGFVYENATRGAFAMAVTATDQDTRASWRSMRFRLVDNDVFALDSSSGALTVRDPSRLDFETQQEFVLNVEVTDGGLLSTEEVVFVSVLNVAEPPVVRPPYRIATPENGVVPRSLFIVNASDPDSDSIESLRFEWVGAPASVTIDALSGVVTLVEPLDFETAATVTVVVNVLKPATALSVSTTFVIDVVDVNEPPQVVSSVVRLQASENLASETPIGPPMAANVWDPENSTLSFLLDASEYSPYFSLDACSGQLRTKRALDYETMPHKVPLRVIVRESGDSTLSAAVSVFVAVQDENEAPAFTLSVFSFSVFENATSGTLVGRLVATDPDVNASLTFGLLSDDPVLPFKVNATSGELTLCTGAALDFEMRTSYALSTSVSDGQLTSTAKIVVSVIDVNEPPRCQNETRFVPENSPGGTVVGGPLAADDVDQADIGIPPVLRLLAPSSSSAVISLEQGSVVVTARDLDFEMRNQYAYTYSACDAQQMCSTCSLVLHVTDMNEPPELPDAQFQVRENTIGWMYTVAATDQDANQTASLVYELAEQSLDNVFQIDALSGRISVQNVSQLNYERIPSHEVWMKVRVTDAGSPRLSSVGKVVAVVQDVNEAPVSASIANTSVLESALNGTVVFTWLVTDEDADQRLTYRITRGNDKSVFRFRDATSPMLLLNARLDFEQTSEYVLELSACDPFTACTTTELHVFVQDVNEPPVLNANANRTLSFAVANTATRGAVLGVLHAIDEDAGDTLTFSLESASADQLSSRVRNGRQAIGVNSTSGELFVAAPQALRDLPSDGHLMMLARVTDASLQSDSVVVIVRVIANNSPPVCTVDSTFVVDENAGEGTSVGVPLRNYVRDDDDGSVVTFTLTHPFLSVHGTTGQLFVSSSTNLDFESPFLNETNVLVLVTDDGALHDGIGRLSTTCSVHVIARDVNEPPTTADLSLTVEEGTQYRLLTDPSHVDRYSLSTT